MSHQSSVLLCSALSASTAEQRRRLETDEATSKTVLPSANALNSRNCYFFPRPHANVQLWKGKDARKEYVSSRLMTVKKSVRYDKNTHHPNSLNWILLPLLLFSSSLLERARELKLNYLERKRSSLTAPSLPHTPQTS